MALIDMHRNNMVRKREELSRLSHASVLSFTNVKVTTKAMNAK